MGALGGGSIGYSILVHSRPRASQRLSLFHPRSVDMKENFPQADRSVQSPVCPQDVACLPDASRSGFPIETHSPRLSLQFNCFYYCICVGMMFSMEAGLSLVICPRQSIFICFCPLPRSDEGAASCPSQRRPMD